MELIIARSAASPARVLPPQRGTLTAGLVQTRVFDAGKVVEP